MMSLLLVSIALSTCGGRVASVAAQPDQAGREVVVRPTDIDDKGHVNNARYLEYLQWGRWEWLLQHKLPPERLRSLRAIPVVVNINLDFKREISFGETVFVQTHVASVRNKTMVFRQVIVGRTGDVRAEGAVTMVTIDPETRKSTLLPPELLQALSAKAGK